MSEITSTTFSAPHTFSDPFPTAFPSDRPRPWRDREEPNQSTSASAYVYAFIGTVSLLLAISALIAFRSLRARRQYRRMVEEGIRNGTYVPPWLEGKKRMDLSQKPVIWNAWLGGGRCMDPRAHAEKDAGEPNAEKYSRIAWKDIMPISVQVVQKQATSKDNDRNTNLSSTPSSDQNTPLPASITGRLRSLLFIGRTSPPASAPNSTAPRIPPPPPPPATRLLPWSSIFLYAPPLDVPSSSRPVPPSSSVPAPAPASVPSLPSQTLDFDSKALVTLRVSLLIAMPSPQPFVSSLKGGDDDDEFEVPYLEVGNVDVEVRGTAAADE